MRRSIVLLSLLLLCSLMGCGLEELPQETKEGTEDIEEITTELVSVSADAASADAVNVRAVTAEQEKQLTILAKNRNQWLSPYIIEDGVYADIYTIDRDYDSIYYSVTDLNQNGQLEIVTYILKGLNVDARYYVNEVKEDGTVEKWHFTERDRDYAQVNLFTDRMTVYYNEEEGTYSYLCGDSTVGGGAGGLIKSPGALLINRKTIEEKFFGCYWVATADGEVKYYVENYGEDGKEIINEKEITRKEYDKIVEKATHQGKKGSAYFGWGNKSLEELLALSEQDIKNELTELSKEFLIQFGTEE